MSYGEKIFDELAIENEKNENNNGTKYTTSEIIDILLQCCIKDSSIIQGFAPSPILMTQQQLEIYTQIKDKNRGLSYLTTRYGFLPPLHDMKATEVVEIYNDTLARRERFKYIQEYMRDYDNSADPNRLTENLIERLNIVADRTKKLDDNELLFFDNEGINEFQLAYEYNTAPNLPIGIKFFDQGNIKINFPNALGLYLLTTGSGKCVVGDTLIPTNTGFKYIKDIAKNTKPNEYNDKILGVYGIDGLENTSKIYNNGISKVVRYKTKKGYEGSGTFKHKIYIHKKDGEFEWEYVRDLNVGDKIPIIRGSNLFSSEKLISKNMARTLGLLTGDVSFSSKSRGKSEDKIVPDSVLSSDKEIICEFLGGLFDSDGYVDVYKRKNKNGSFSNKTTIGLMSKSKQLIDEVQLLLLNLGIISNKSVKKVLYKGKRLPYYRLSIDNILNISLFNKNITLIKDEKQQRIIEYLEFSKDKIVNLNDDFVYDCCDILKLVVELNKKLLLKDNSLYHHIIRGDRNLTYMFLNKILSIYEIYKDDKNYQKLEEIVDKNYYYDEIIEIKETKEETFDFVVPKTHSFVGNGIINHNTFSLLNTARHSLLDGKKVMYIHTEMNKGEMATRFIPMITNGAITQSMIKEGKNELYLDYKRKNLQELKDNFYLIGPKHFNGLLSVYDVQYFIQRYKPDLVLIDYLQKMEGAANWEEPVTVRLKKYCDDYGINMICAVMATEFARFDPDFVDGMPESKHIAKCKSMLNDADWMISAKTVKSEDLGGLIYTYKIIKGRQGQGRDCDEQYILIPETGLFMEKTEFDLMNGEVIEQDERSNKISFT